jgi:hypothetical protein
MIIFLLIAQLRSLLWNDYLISQGNKNQIANYSVTFPIWCYVNSDNGSLREI